MITTHGLEHLGFDPDKDFVLSDDGNGVYIKKWNSASPQPTEAEIEAAHAQWETEQAATQYQRDRKAEYDQLNQYEMMFDDEVNGTTTWIDAINAIKAKYPKPE
jgi:predicted phosphoribosyltransferase